MVLSRLHGGLCEKQPWPKITRRNVQSVTTVSEASVSVIVPAFRSSYLRECLASIFTQTVLPTEVIVVDGSPDRTVPILEEFRSRIVHIEQPPRGVSAARNAGIEAAKGDYVAFLDADDLWLPEKLEYQLAGFLRFPDTVFSFCTVWNLTESSNPGIPDEPFFPPNLLAWLARSGENEGFATGSVYELILAGNCIATSSLMIRREALKKLSWFDERMRNGEDYEFELRLARTYPAVFVKHPLVRYRIHSAGLSGAWNERTDLFYRANIDALVKHYDQHPSAQVKSALARTYADRALFRLKERQYTEAHSLARTSLGIRLNQPAVRYYLEAKFPRVYA